MKITMENSYSQEASIKINWMKNRLHLIFLKHSLTLKLRYSPAKQNMKTSVIIAIQANAAFTEPTPISTDCFVQRLKTA